MPIADPKHVSVFLHKVLYDNVSVLICFLLLFGAEATPVTQSIFSHYVFVVIFRILSQF